MAMTAYLPFVLKFIGALVVDAAAGFPVGGGILLIFRPVPMVQSARHSRMEAI